MHEHGAKQPEKRHNFVMWAFFGIILYFLVTEHWAHIFPYLPWLLFLACPLLHLFMHGGHGGHGHGGGDRPGQGGT